MYQAQVSSKGQVVIPKPLRERWGISEGSTISFTEDAQGLHLTVQREATREDLLRSLQAGPGIAGYRGPARTSSEVRDALRSAFRRKKP